MCVRRVFTDVVCPDVHRRVQEWQLIKPDDFHFCGNQELMCARVRDCQRAHVCPCVPFL